VEEKITCAQCNSRIKSTANFCENCGASVSTETKVANRSSTDEVLDSSAVLNPSTNNFGQKLIFVGLMMLFVSTFYYFLLGVVVDITDNWGLYQTLEPISLIVSFVNVGIALIIALGMNSGTRKTVAIILSCIYALINLYWFIDRLIPDDVGLEYLNF